MRCFLTLLRLHFTGSAVHRATTLAGLLLTALGCLGLWRYQQYITIGRDYDYSKAAIAFGALVGTVPVLGIVLLFLGGGLMPIILVHLSRSRQLMLLPGGRRQLLVSCFAVLALLAGVFAVMMEILYARFPLDQREVLGKAFIVSFLIFTLLYTLLWVVSQARSALMMLSGMMLLLPCLLLPFRYVQMPSTSIAGPLIGGAMVMAAGSLLFLAWPKESSLTITLSGIMPPPARAFRTDERTALARYLRLSHPIIVALIQVIPLGIASIFIDEPSLWLFYFVLCSIMSGASASKAASRTRALWLLLPGARSELYLKVERTFWRHDAYAVLMLIGLLIVLGHVRELASGLLAIGIPLLVIGFALGLYLGLMMIGRLKLLDAFCAAASTCLMLVLAYCAARASVSFTMGSLCALSIAAVAFRESSRRRWRVIDWAENRPARGAAGA